MKVLSLTHFVSIVDLVELVCRYNIQNCKNCKNNIFFGGNKGETQLVEMSYLISMSISLLFNTNAGSPYHPRVVDSRKVRLEGDWHTHLDREEKLQLIVGQSKRLLFDVSRAGPGW